MPADRLTTGGARLVHPGTVAVPAGSPIAVPDRAPVRGGDEPVPEPRDVALGT